MGLTAKKLPAMTERQVARFWARVVKGDGCWIWTGPDKIMVAGRKYKPTRIAYALSCGEPEGCVVRLCDTPGCVFPGHLKDVSHHETWVRSRVGSVLKIRKCKYAALYALNENKPLVLIDAIMRGKLL